MIKKEKLLSDLTELIRCKENISVLLQKNVSSAFTMSALDENAIRELKEFFSETVDKQNTHIQMLQQIQNDVVKEEVDVY